MRSQLWSNLSGFNNSHWLLLILLVVQLGTQEAAIASSSTFDAAEQQLRVEFDQPSTSWLNFSGHHWPLGDDGDGTCQPPMLRAPVKSSKSGSTVPKGQGSQQARQTQGGAASSRGSRGASGSSGWSNTGPQVAQGRSSGATVTEHQLENFFSCKDYDGRKNVDWFIVIKEHGSYDYVYATSGNQGFSGRQRSIHNSGPLYNTLRQTYQNQTALLFYSYTSFGSGDNEGHQNGVLLFGKSRGFWLIHSWRRLFEYFLKREFPNPEKTNGQAFICTTHSTTADLGNIGKQLFVSKPHPYAGHIFKSQNFQSKYWTDIFDGEYVTDERIRHSCGDQHSCKHEFIIGKLIHYSKSRLDETDIYDSIASDNGIDLSSSCLMVQSWNTSGNQGVVQNVPDHEYHPDMKSMNTRTDHSKWCVPVPIGAGRPRNQIKFVCIGDLNRGRQTNRPGGAMCLWNDAVWQYFKDICPTCT